MRILHDPSATINEKLHARGKADDLMGLQAPKRVIEAQVEVDDVLDVWVDNLTVEQKMAIDQAASVAEEVEKVAALERTIAREQEYRRAVTPSNDPEDEFDNLVEGEVEVSLDDEPDPLGDETDSSSGG